MPEHYRRAVLAKRVFERIEKRADGHWIWKGVHNTAGKPPAMGIGIHVVGVPRIVWELEGRAPLAGTGLEKICDVPLCVAPRCYRRVEAGAGRPGRPLAYFLGEEVPKVAPPPSPPKPGPKPAPAPMPEPKPAPVPKPEPVQQPVALPLTAKPVGIIVGPFGSGGIVVFTPWGTFNGELVLREPEKR